MKIWSKMPLILSLSLAIAWTATGCSDGGREKEKIQQALAKQSEMKTFAFTGSADLDLEPVKAGGETGQNPVTASLLGLFTKSRLEWNGIAALDPLRMEADLKSTPSGSSTPIELPFLLKDNKVYLNIPLLNRKDEYYLVDMEKLASSTGGQAGAFQPESLKNITKSSSEMLKLALTDVSPKQFKKGTSVTLKDGTKADVITLQITEKNNKELSEAVRGKLGEIADALAGGGIMTPGQADNLKKNSGKFQLEAPGQLSVSIDADGFIREQTVQLSYVTTGSDGKERKEKLSFTQAYNEINKEPKFTKEEPKNVRPLSDILKLLMPQAPAKK